MTVPDFLENAEQEDAAELRALIGVNLNQPTSDAQLDALASDVCRQLARFAADRARYEEAEAAELARIRTFYANRVAPIALRIQQLEAIGAEIAQRATFPGKSKSRKVAFGCYGSRKIAEKVSVVDEGKALAWARINHPYAIETKTVEKLSAVAIKGAVLAVVHQSGEVPDGFDHVGESEKFFIKPEP